MSREDRLGQLLAEARAALSSLLETAEIADTDPRDKDPDTHAAEREARRIISASRDLLAEPRSP